MSEEYIDCFMPIGRGKKMKYHKKEKCAGDPKYVLDTTVEAKKVPELALKGKICKRCWKEI